MTLPPELTTVTRLSKLVALILFITLPILAFILGMNYQKRITPSIDIPVPPIVKVPQYNLLPSPPMELPKIGQVYEVGTNILKVTINNYVDPVWLCIQEDWYSKPSNESCNSGTLLERPDYDFTANIEDGLVLKLYDSGKMLLVYDEVIVKKENNTITTKHLEELCGTVLHDTDHGRYFIDGTRLLTAPGWQELIPFVNKTACVQGETYDDNSFRVYFIQNSQTEPTPPEMY